MDVGGGTPAGQRWHYRGPTGIGCLVVGVILVGLGWDLIRDRPPESATVFMPVAVAQGNATSGWVYLGRSIRRGDWAFGEIVDHDGTLQAKRRVNIREEHYENLTGTLLGYALGVETPSRIGEVARGDCVCVRDRVEVGVFHIWLKIDIVACPT